MNLAVWTLVGAMVGGSQDPRAAGAKPHPQPHATPAAPAVAATPTPADAVTLRDGKVVRGQVVESTDRRGPLVVLVRRAWAAQNLPDLYATWTKTEAPTLRRAEAQRLERLRAWRRDRPADLTGSDLITPWLDGEISRLEAALKPDAPSGETSRLMAVPLPRTSVRTVDRRHRLTGRLLRLAWTMNLDDAEARPVDQLKQALEDRGFAVSGDSPVVVDHLLPTPVESDAEWLTRRAATEVQNSPENRFAQFGGAVVPEKLNLVAQGPNATPDALNAVVNDLLGAARGDSLPAKFRQLAARGQVGAEVTSMELAPDMSSTTATTTLYVNPGGGRPWVAAASRSSNVRPGDLPADAGAQLANDPQVQGAFDLINNLGLGNVAGDLKQRSLNMGSATQKALGEARTSLRDDLKRLAIPLERPRSVELAPTATPAP